MSFTALRIKNELCRESINLLLYLIKNFHMSPLSFFNKIVNILEMCLVCDISVTHALVLYLTASYTSLVNSGQCTSCSGAAHDDT